MDRTPVAFRSRVSRRRTTGALERDHLGSRARRIASRASRPRPGASDATQVEGGVAARVHDRARDRIRRLRGATWRGSPRRRGGKARADRTARPVVDLQGRVPQHTPRLPLVADREQQERDRGKQRDQWTKALRHPGADGDVLPIGSVESRRTELRRSSAKETGSRLRGLSVRARPAPLGDRGSGRARAATSRPASARH